MAKRRPHFEAMEMRLCPSSATLQTTITLPQGSWTATVYRASPIFADLFNTGKDDLIAVASGAQLVAYRENADGSATPVVTYKVPAGVADIKSTPIVVTDPRTGRKDLFAAMGRDENNNLALEDGRVFGWDAQTGNLLPGFVNGVSSGVAYTGNAGVYGALTSGDLQGNGIPDLVVTSFSHEISAITLDGQILWQWDNDDSVISGAVVADIGRDGTPEVVVGGDSSASAYFQNGGWVNVISNTGQTVWREHIPGEVTWSSPVVADLLNNGQLDIVIGTGVNFSDTLGTAYTEAGDYIYAFDPDGNMLPGWPYHTTYNGDTANHEVLGSLAVADLTGDGQLDVVALDASGYIHAIQPNGTDLPGFAGGKRLDPDLSPSQLLDNFGSPTIADVTGNGVPDIIAGSGPFLRAFDPQGNLIEIGTAPLGTSNLPEGIDVAPVVGNFDGGPGLTLALTTYDGLSPGGPGRPDKIQIYQLPPSTLAPPWPMLRRTATGDAVARSPAYDARYVAQAFDTIQGGLPSLGTLQLYLSALNSDTSNLLTTAQSIASSLPTLQTEVARAYLSLLGHTPDAYALQVFSAYLTTHTVRQMEALVASSAEFAQRAGGNPATEVALLYRAILGRAPAAAETTAFVNAKLPPGTIATILLNSSEALTDQFDGIIQAMFGPGTQSLIPADAEAAYSYDIHAGMSEAAIVSLTLDSAGNLATTNALAGYIQNLYRDILFRDGSPGDVAGWLRAVDAGAVAPTSLAADFENSTEAIDDYIQQEYAALLGHAADPGTLAALAAVNNRQTILIDIVGSPEYFAHNGGTDAGFVAAAFRDEAAFPASSTEIAGIVAQMQQGVSPAQVASSIIYSGPLYFANLVVNELEYYIPIESQGVLRTGEIPPNAPGQPVNPSPALLAYFTGLYQQGATDAQVLTIMLNTPMYYSQSIYYRGLYRTPGVRY